MISFACSGPIPTIELHKDLNREKDMKQLSKTILCLVVIGLSAPTYAQYSGYGSGEGRRGGGDSYGEGRRGGGDGYGERRRDGDFDGRRGGGGQARGSFASTCRDIDQRGSTLNAMCRTTRGNYEPAQINVERCGGRPIANQNGRRAC